MTLEKRRQPLEQKTYKPISHQKRQDPKLELTALFGMAFAFTGGFVIGGLLVAFLLRAGGWK